MLTAAAIDCDTALIFPERLIPVLQDQRGEVWQNLVQQTLAHPATSFEQAAFILMVARLAGCSTCHADALRALRGCGPCARQAIARFRGDDRELIEMYHQAFVEIQEYLLVNQESQVRQK